MAIFLRLTLTIAAVLVALLAIGVLFKIFVTAGILAAIALGGFFAFHFLRGLFSRNRALTP